MANANPSKFLYTNLVVTTAGTLTPSSEATGYDADNLRTRNYSETWRSTAAGAGAETVVIDLGSAQSVSAVALGNVNIRSSATVKIQGHTADSWGTPDVDETIDVSAMTGVRRNLYHDLAQSYSKRYWRISVIDNGNPDGFIEIGAWALGVPVQLTDAFDATFRQNIVRGNVELRTDYQQAFGYGRDWGYRFDLTWTNCETATITTLRSLSIAQEGNVYPFFFAIDPDAPAECYYVRIAQDLDTGRINENRHNAAISFMEEMPGASVPR